MFYLEKIKKKKKKKAKDGADLTWTGRLFQI